MENDQNRTNLIMIIVLISVILLIAVFVNSNHINPTESNTEKQDDESNEVTKKDTTVEEQPELYKSYEIGNQITLLDSSSWHVIKNTTKKEETITLLKDSKLSTELKKEEINNFLTTTYVKLLKDSLSALSTDIKEVRLITLDDIKLITGIETLEKETFIEKENSTWLYQDDTITSNTSVNNIPLQICKIEEEEIIRGKLCEITDKETWPIRPVIIISKEYIKE